MISIFGKRIKIQKLMNTFNQAPTWNNPMKGTSEIIKATQTHIWYRRGKSVMRISINLINQIYDHIIANGYKNQPIYSKDIVKIKDIVDPTYKGWHDCDATFIMMLMRCLLGANIVGKRPCYVIF